MELKDTIELMCSDSYRERFKAEYYQTKERYEKLHTLLVKYDAKTLDFNPTDIELLREQKKYMGKYLYILEVRAEKEKITL
jgi:hypothetical protein